MGWVWTVAVAWVALAVLLAVLVGRAVALRDRRGDAALDPVAWYATPSTDDPGEVRSPGRPPVL